MTLTIHFGAWLLPFCLGVVCGAAAFFVVAIRWVFKDNCFLPW